MPVRDQNLVDYLCVDLGNPHMTEPSPETLAPEVDLALAYTSQAHRGAFAMFFRLDSRLARIVAATSEPMLGQMRLSWWRDMLGKSQAEWPKGDEVLDGIAAHWGAQSPSLVALVDAWEVILVQDKLLESAIKSYAAGRSAALLAAFAVSNKDTPYRALLLAAQRWALADLAANVSSQSERAMLVKLGLGYGSTHPRLPGFARGLAVLGALGLRSLKKGGRPLLEGRGASLVAMRAAITRR